jgi:ABC-type antimicrobial peptide transport system permease subunit
MLVGKFLFMINVFDLVAYAGGICLVLFAGVLAAAIPISRVAHTSPLDAIRQE